MSKLDLAPPGSNAPRSQRIRVLIISHAYLEPENVKTLLTLLNHVDVRVLVPRRLPVPRQLKGLLFKNLDSSLVQSQYPSTLITSCRALYRPGSPYVAQYALASLSFGLRRQRPDIIHVDLPPWSPVFWQAALARKLFAPSARILVSAKKNTYRRHPGVIGGAKAVIARAGARRADLVVAASRMAEELYLREFQLPRGQVETAHLLGVDGRRFRPAIAATTRGPCVVGYCGRTELEKGVLDLVQAVARCRAEGSNVQLQLAGSGTLDGQLNAIAEQRPWLSFHGALAMDDVPDFLRTLDIFVLPARITPDHEEHDAHALREALASGVASIGTRSGVIPDLLSDGTGLMVEANDPERLALAIERLVGAPALREDFARKALEKARRELLCEPVAALLAKMYMRTAGCCAPEAGSDLMTDEPSQDRPGA